jgi:hypothetical protein
VLALALSVAAAGSASGEVVRSGGFKYVTTSFTLQPGGARTHKAACPKRTHVLSGGHYNSGLYGDVIGVHSYPYDGDDRDKKPDDGWAAQLRGFGETYPAKAYAICARTFPEYRKETATVDPTRSEGQVAVDCEVPAHRVTGGGSRGPASVGEVLGYVHTQFQTNYWQQGLANYGDGPHEVTVYAICANLAPSYSGIGINVSPGTQSLAEGMCPPQAPHVIGGGVGAPEFPNSSIQGRTAIAATRPGSGLGSWQVWLDNYNRPPTTVQVYSIAVCSPPL